MQITCWGSRGSIPVSGPGYLKYGGDTTCLEVRAASGRRLIVDAGTGIRRLGQRLAREGCLDFDLLFTHAHWDHLMGLPFFRPLYFPAARIHIHGCRQSQGSIKHVFTSPYFPVRYEDIRARLQYHELDRRGGTLGGVRVRTIPLSHPGGGLGFRFEEDGRSVVFITDNELGQPHAGAPKLADYVRFAAGADLLIHDAEYTLADYRQTRGWGHSTYRDALELALAAGVKRFGLFHHNQGRTDRAVARLVRDCRRRVRARGSALQCFAVAEDTVLPW